MFTLDTNAIIYYLKNDHNAAAVLENIFAQEAPLYISTITEAELFGYSRLTAEDYKRIDELLSTLSIIPLDSHLARIAGYIRRSFNVRLPDSIIAATSLFTQSTLVTRNLKDFVNIPELKVCPL